LAQLLGNSVVFIDDEVLVEDLEDLATLKLSHGGGGVVRKEMEGEERWGEESGRGQEEGARKNRVVVEMVYRRGVILVRSVECEV
jgi:hypothetical protein